MNYYKHHIGDYAAATAHLSWDEDMAYTRLMRAYYQAEKPIPADIKDACRLARASTPAQRRAVEVVLREFFILEEDGWHQSRCDEEIGHKQGLDSFNREIGKRGGRPRKDKTETESDTNKNPTGFQNETQPVLELETEPVLKNNPSHKPIASNHKETPPTPKGDFGFAHFWEAYPRKDSKPKALESWLKIKPDESLLARIIAALDRQKRSDQWIKDRGQFIPMPATYLNQRRWEDAGIQLPATNGLAGRFEAAAERPLRMSDIPV